MEKKKKVKAIISRSNTGFVIMMDGFDAAMSYGDTLAEAKKDFENFPKEYIEVSKEADKEIPEILNNGNLEFEYVYDLSGFFAHFDFLSPTKLARRINENPGLLRQYAAGCTYVSNEKKKRIEKELHKIGKELLSVSF